jgi:L-amino acid N-acyltransferase
MVGDLPGIFAIYDREVLHGTCTFDTRPKTEAERLEWFNNNPGGRYPIVVADDGEAGGGPDGAGGRVAGWARLYQWSPRPAYERTAENAVYVDAAYRGRGLGRALLVDVLRRGYDAGVRTVIARIAEGNPESVVLHEKVGFTTIGVMHRVGEKFGVIRDVRMMEREMDSGRP